MSSFGVHVYLRVRPKLEREKADGELDYRTPNPNTFQLPQKAYKGFTGILKPEAQNTDVFTTCMQGGSENDSVEEGGG